MLQAGDTDFKLTLIGRANRLSVKLLFDRSVSSLDNWMDGLVKMNRVILFVVLAVCLSCSSSTPDRFSSPEETLKTYINAARAGDKQTILTCFHPKKEDFYLPGPIHIDSFAITKKTVYGQPEAEEWNRLGIVPPAEAGDIDINVEEIHGGRSQMYSYLLRRVDGEWKIIAYSAWGVP